MNPIDATHLINMGIACLGAFFVIVSAGSLFIYFRIRKQNAAGGPAPEPPPMTIDAHASEGTSALPSVEPPAAVQNPTPVPTPTPSPVPPSRPPPARKTFTPIDEDADDLTEKSQKPFLPAGVHARPEDETERVRLPVKPADPTFIAPSELEDLEAETATVIIDRSKPMDEDPS